jgi:hypothetical protein
MAGGLQEKEKTVLVKTTPGRFFFEGGMNICPGHDCPDI